jgi:hypothetical protein
MIAEKNDRGTARYEPPPYLEQIIRDGARCVLVLPGSMAGKSLLAGMIAPQPPDEGGAQ